MQLTDSPAFGLQETTDPDGAARVLLIGELDLAGVAQLDECLSRLRKARAHSRLDLSELKFIDSSGLRVLVTSRRDADRDSWQLEIGTELCPQVRKLVELTGVGPMLWPNGTGVQQTPG